MIEFRVMTEEEIAASQIQWERTAAEEAARKVLVDACGEHEWELDLYDPEDDMLVSLRCARCPADIEDAFMVDGTELIYAEFDNGVVVDEGKHNSPVALTVPVTVGVWSTSGWTDYGMEYDAGIEIEQRGPSRPLALPGVNE